MNTELANITAGDVSLGGLSASGGGQSIDISPAMAGDLDWIDALQKRHRDRVGWHPRGTLEGKIALGQIIVARMNDGERVGYCMASDRYMKREDCGIIYQMNVEPGRQRASIGAALLHAQFQRSAYGCRLYCCWCAQDIEANRFWEAMGFVPLAYRAGSEARSRTHIFWQTRVREDDCTTPWWYPSQTQGGSMEDRLVFPIRLDTHWSEAKPLILPGNAASESEPARIAGPRVRKGKKAVESIIPPTPKRLPLSGALIFTAPAQPTPATAQPATPAPKIRARRAKVKNDPKLVLAARELRDRYLEQINDGRVIQFPRKRGVTAMIATGRAMGLLSSAA